MTALLSVIVLAASTFSTPLAPEVCSNALAPVEQAHIASGFSANAKAMCTATCGTSPSVSCSASTCSAMNQSCPGQRGYVTCGSSTFYCPVCPPSCTEGQIKSVITGPNCSCENGTSTPKDRYKCIGGEWVYQFSFCSGPFCQGF